MILGNNISFYDVKITGKDVKRFLHNLHKMHIEFLNITFFKNSVIIKVSKEDYKKILSIKTIYEIEVVKVYGLAYIEYFIKRYFIFFIILLLGALLFFGLTHIVFEVEVVHNDKDLRNLILEELKQEGIYKHGFTVTYQKKEKIKANILKKYKDKIEWLEIEKQGTKYTVKVEERKKNSEITNTTCQNIVAKKNGIIKKITSSTGEVVAKKDQYVKEGDILISGTIHNKEIEVAKVKAEGLVYAETWYTVNIELPYHYHEEIKTENKQRTLRIQWFQNNTHLFAFKKYKNYNDQDIFTLKSPLLPISLALTDMEEVNIIDKVYTKENAVIAAKELAQQRLKNKLGEDIEILYEKNLKISEENSKIIVVMFYKVYENITDYEEISPDIENNKTE